MRTWLRRVLYVVVLLAWLLVMALPLGAVMLAVNKQIQVGNEPRSYMRLFMVEERDAQGVGIEWTRQTDDRQCSETRLEYYLWEGEGPGSVFCRCYDDTGALETTFMDHCGDP